MSQWWPASSDPASAVRLAPVTPAAWDAFVYRHPAALLFHTSDWLRLLRRVYGSEFHQLGAWSGHRLVGLLPLLTRKLGPFRLAGSPLMQTIASTPFMGPLTAPEWIAPTLIALESVLSCWRIDHIEIAFPALLADLTLPKRLGYSIETCQTVVMDLRGRTVDQLWQGLSSACRRAIRKAERHRVKIIEMDNRGFLDEYYRMCEEVYTGSGRPPHLSKAFYVAAWDALASRGKMHVRMALHRGEILAGAVFLSYRETAYYLSGASHDRGLELRPNNLIQWHFIEQALAKGYRWYDMGGAVVQGITRFKLSFGGQLWPYTRLYRANSALARAGRAVYRRVIPLWRRLLA
jgi:CelD/BcsL family acetyltransferase involved in cellulose biosynthesis